MRIPLWPPVLAWCAVIFLGSSFEGSPMPNPTWADWCLRKSAHLGEYAVLFLLTRRALAGERVERSGLAAFVLCVVYAASDEFHQTMVLFRNGNAGDVLIDACGAFLASRWAKGPRRA